MRFSNARVRVAGDFNSNATHTPPERTPSVGLMRSRRRCSAPSGCEMIAGVEPPCDSLTMRRSFH